MKSDLKTTVKGVDLVGTQPNKQANQIHWSPQGKYLVLGGLKVLPSSAPAFALPCPALARRCPALT